MNRKFILILLSVVAAIALLVFAVACGRTVTVTFDEGGATKTVSVKSGSVVQDYTPQKDGYEFSCWTEKESGAEFDFSQPITEDVTLVAVWQYARVTVRFDSAGGTAVPFQTFDKGGCASLPEAPQNGYKAFAGWYRQGEDEPFDFSLPVFESLTLVAKWETIRVAVYFDSDGGSVVPARIAEKGECIAAPSATKKEGFDFVCWRKEDGEEFSFEEPVLSSMTLKAEWRVNSFRVCFDAAGGTETESQLVEKGGKAVFPESYRFGYVLLGWYEEGSETPFDFEKGIYENVFLCARWEATDAFEGLCGEWTGRSATEKGDAHYCLLIDGDGGAAFSVTGDDCAFSDGEAEVFTYGENRVIVSFKDGGQTRRIDFVWDGIGLSSQKAFFDETLELEKTPDALFDPAELAGVWKGVAQADFFGETVEVSYVLDITFDGKGVLTYEARDSETELLIVGFYAKDNLLVVEYVYFQGAQTSYFISFRVDGDRLICDSAIFGETLVLKREDADGEGKAEFLRAIKKF